MMWFLIGVLIIVSAFCVLSLAFNIIVGIIKCIYNLIYNIFFD
jgi:hypothetical protein